jgi:dolichol kinase
MAMGVVATFLYQFLLTRGQSVAVLATLLTIFGSLEISRRFSPRFNHFLLTSRLFKPIARPREYYRVNSATYYLVALCTITPLFSKPAVQVGILILAFADPAAAWLGKKYGRKKHIGTKTWLGSFAFLFVAVVVAFGFLAAFHTELPLSGRLLAALVASVVATVAESFSRRLDDNLTIPIAAAASAALFV